MEIFEWDVWVARPSSIPAYSSTNELPIALRYTKKGNGSDKSGYESRAKN